MDHSSSQTGPKIPLTELKAKTLPSFSVFPPSSLTENKMFGFETNLLKKGYCKYVNVTENKMFGFETKLQKKGYCKLS